MEKMMLLIIENANIISAQKLKQNHIFLFTK